MKTVLTSLLLAGLSVLTSAQTPGTYRQPVPKKSPPAATGVLICESRSAYAYHAYECRGLSRCRHTVSRVSLAEARNRGYQPCRICH